jgi:hypothetical protein
MLRMAYEKRLIRDEIGMDEIGMEVCVELTLTSYLLSACVPICFPFSAGELAAGIDRGRGRFGLWFWREPES